MSKHSLFAAPALFALLAFSPGAAVAQTQQSDTITATGTGQTRVVPKNRHSNASIVAAVDAARKASIKGALKEAHEYALQYAKDADMTLGTVISVSDAQTNGYIGPGYIGPGFIGGSFGPSQYCGTIQQLVGRPARGKKPKFRKVHRCFVPRFAFTTLTVTYSAS
jgi:uncharacterized protein YggE